jgi:hypothetical protein
MDLVGSHAGYGSEQPVGKLAADARPDLGHLLHRDQAVEARHQRITQGRRDSQCGQGPVQHQAPVALLEHPGFEHRLGQLLDEQRHTVGLGDDLVEDLGR